MVEGLRTLGLIVLSALLGLGVAMPVAAQQCDIDIILLNKDRLITGEVDAECPSVLPPGVFHSAPFGNWGVESNLSDHRVDGFQFSGWKIEGLRLRGDSSIDTGMEWARSVQGRATRRFPLAGVASCAGSVVAALLPTP